MAHVEKGILLLSASLALSACWEDRGSCELWAKKLAQATETSLAIGELAKNRCVGERAALLAHLDDTNLGADVLEALIALGRSPEAEAAVLRSLGRAETTVAAAKQVTTWKLAAENELRAALANQTLAPHHEALLEAALTVAPPARWVGTLVRELADEGPTQARALAVLATVATGAQDTTGDWSAVPEAERAAVVLALAELASRPEATAERSALALHTLATIPWSGALAAEPIVTRAAAGQRAALLALWCLDQPSLPTALTLLVRAGVTPPVRSLATAIVAREEDGAQIAALVASAPSEDDIALALALAGGAAVVPALEARVASDKGSARAAFARALALALPAERLAAWAADLRASPSQLLRTIPDEPAVAAVVARTQKCAADPVDAIVACHLAALEADMPALAQIDAALGVARAALRTAQTAAEAAVAGDAERAQVLAKTTGAELDAARRELEAIAARRDAIYVAVGEASRQVAALEAVPLAAIDSLAALRRIDGPAADRAARTILTSCRGEACAALRAWAAVAVSERTLACRFETPEATP